MHRIVSTIRRVGFAIIVLCLLLNALNAWALPVSSLAGRAVLIKIQGGIGPGTASFVQSSIQRANQSKAAAIVVQLDTPGGLGVSMRDIIQSVLHSKVPVLGYVAPAGARAASAGTYILYACSVAAMAPGTNLGAATPVSMGSVPSAQGGSGTSSTPSSATNQTGKTKQLKAINDAKAYIRSLAQLHGRNASWAEQAVSKAASLSANEAVKKEVVDFTAKDLEALLVKADGRTVLVDGTKVRLKTADLHVIPLSPTWREHFLMILSSPKLVYLLLILGIYGLFFEFTSPGYILPGVVGSIAIVAAMFGLQMLPVNYVGLSLIVLGIMFLIGELFVGSMGLLALGGMVAMAFGSILLFDQGIPGFDLSLSFVITVVIVSGLLFLFLLYFAVRSQTNRVVSGTEAMVGQRGHVVKNEKGLWLRYRGELWKISNPNELKAGQQCTIRHVLGLEVEVELKNKVKE